MDFGLGRGLSGAIEAKHRLGMAAANFAGMILYPKVYACMSWKIGLEKLIWGFSSLQVDRDVDDDLKMPFKCINSIRILYKVTPSRFHELKKKKHYKKRENKSSIDFEA